MPHLTSAYSVLMAQPQPATWISIYVSLTVGSNLPAKAWTPGENQIIRR